MECESILWLCVWGIICQKNVLLYFTVNGSLMSWCVFELVWNKKMQPSSHTDECDEIISMTSLYFINLTSSLQESFSSMKYLLLVTLFYSVLLPLLWTSPTSTLKPGSPVAFYLECRLQREAGILLFEICEMPLNLTFSIPHRESSPVPVPGKRLTVNGSIFNVFPKYFGPEWRAGFNIRDCQGRQRARQADMTRNHSSGDYVCSLPFPAHLSGSLSSQKRLFQSRKIFSFLLP